MYSAVCVYTGKGLCSLEGNSRSERPADSVEKDKTNICLFIWSGILMSLRDRGKARIRILMRQFYFLQTHFGHKFTPRTLIRAEKDGSRAGQTKDG